MLRSGNPDLTMLGWSVGLLPNPFDEVAGQAEANSFADEVAT
jgi:hypothetical protein